ncbi:hypothetical protein PGB90_009856 [Kerria lacca]
MPNRSRNTSVITIEGKGFEAMLQHVLKDMYIDPELLAGLNEFEKETLFCCMREEQIKRWKIWDQKETEIQKTEPPRIKRKGSKSVKWLLDNTGEPLVYVIDTCSSYEDEKLDKTSTEECDLNAEYEQKELRLSIKDSHCINLETNETNNKVSKYINVVSDNKTSSPSVIINFNEKRGALQELSLNKVPKVARQVAEWEKRVTQEDSKSLNKISINVKKEVEHATETEVQQEQLWREQQKKAKEVEIRMRTIARLAREEHRRSLLIENNNENFQNFVIVDNMFDVCKNIKKPPNKETILEWYRTNELPKNAGIENNKATEWFYGFINREEAEEKLKNEKLGTFLVRISECLLGYAISLKNSSNVKHYLIDTSNGYYQILGDDRIRHCSLSNLVTYHETHPLTSNGDEFLIYPCLKYKNLSTLLDASN